MSLKKEVKRKENINGYLNKAIENIESDREQTNSILTDLLIQAKDDYEKTKSLGFIIAKHLDSLMKNNDQLIKIISILKGKDSSDELTESEKSTLYDTLQKERDNENKENEKN